MMGRERRGRLTPRAAVAVSVAGLLVTFATITLMGASARSNRMLAECRIAAIRMQTRQQPGERQR